MNFKEFSKAFSEYFNDNDDCNRKLIAYIE